RAFEYGVRILKLCSPLDDRGAGDRHIARQLIRCGTSIGSNAEEAQEAQTKPDYIAKMALSRKEASESRYWLRLGIAAGTFVKGRVDWELSEANQLLAMIISAIKTAQASSSRGSAAGT